jgi:hypothetical protein
MVPPSAMTYAEAFPRLRSGCRPSCVISFAGPIPQGNLKANSKQASPERMLRARKLGCQIIGRMTMTANTTITMMNSRTEPKMISTLGPQDCDDPRIRDRAGGFRE